MEYFINPRLVRIDRAFEILKILSKDGKMDFGELYKEALKKSPHLYKKSKTLSENFEFKDALSYLHTSSLISIDDASGIVTITQAGRDFIHK
ncbi:MAG: hypothetical protein ACTSWN_12000 [Promethearchaeota archaeon]